MKIFRIPVKVLALTIFILFLFSGCAGPSGISVTDADINETGHLVLKFSNGQTIDAGNVVGPAGPAGKTISSTVSFVDIVPAAEPSITRVDVTLRNGFSAGSGTIIDKRGFIITNAHVVNGARSIEVTLKDGTQLPATIIRSDNKKDMAIIKLTTDRIDFPAMQLGTMADVTIGMPVMAMGFPIGPDLPGPATFTAGVVSAIREYSGEDYIQTDTPLNPGNSGGCLFDLNGKMLGIPTAIITPNNHDFEDINLVIPIEQASAFIEQNVK